MRLQTEPAPAFQFYVKEWRGSRAVQLMTFAVRGMYFEMLLEQWEKFTIPDSAAACAYLLGGTLEEWEIAWAQLRPNFVKRGRGGMFNLRLERVRRELRAFKEQFDHTRKQGGINRAKSATRRKDGTYLPAGLQLPSSSPPAAIQLSPGTSSSSSSSTPSPTASAEVRPLPDARSKRPVYTSDRFAVFEWQFDELSKMLGPHFDAFGIDGFFDALTQSSRKSGLVIAKADVWPWLQVQVLAEAKRRGLPSVGSTGPPSVAEDAREVAKLLGIDPEKAGIPV